MADFTTLPDNLPIPHDDGAADHLTGLAMPTLSVQTSDRRSVDLAAIGPGRTIIYIYPLTGRPGVDLPEGWDAIPGARGCSTEACDFRDHSADLRAAGATQVWGLSSQDPDYQAEVVERLRLPFRMLSDPEVHRGRLAQPADLLGTRTRAAVFPPHNRCPRGTHRAHLLPSLPAQRTRPAGSRLAPHAPDGVTRSGRAAGTGCHDEFLLCPSRRSAKEVDSSAEVRFAGHPHGGSKIPAAIASQTACKPPANWRLTG
jgi:peroxiredoxin